MIGVLSLLCTSSSGKRSWHSLYKRCAYKGKELFRFSSRHACTYGFFFQAEDGIRDLTVTGVQTCALPILSTALAEIAETKHLLERLIISSESFDYVEAKSALTKLNRKIRDLGKLQSKYQIGRASCRERV